MSVSVRMRRLGLSAATTALAGAALLAPAAVAEPNASDSPGQGGLLDHVPEHISASCIPAMDRLKAEGALPPGTVDAVACPVDSSSGQTNVLYLAFGDNDSLQDAFIREIPLIQGQGTCEDGKPGHGGYDQGNAQDVGKWACFTAPDGYQEFAWTHEPSRIMAVLVDPQLGLAELDRLWYDLGPTT